MNYKKVLDQNEKVLLIVGSSWWRWFWSLIFSSLFIVLAFLLLYPLFSIGIWGVIIFFALLVFALFILVRVYILKKGNIFVMTNKRIFDNYKKRIFSKECIELEYNLIKNIAYGRTFFDIFLNLGEVYIFLKEEEYKIKLLKIKNYKLVSDNIFKIWKKILKNSFSSKSF